MFIQPVKSSFTINDVSGASVGVNVNYNIFGVSIFTNSNQSYIGLMIGIGLGIGGSYVETNTTINKVDNQLIQIQNEIYFRYAPH